MRLENLNGNGVLDGKYASVKNGAACEGGYGAFSEDNRFSFSFGEPSFEEAMTYYFADGYRSFLDEKGLIGKKKSIDVIAHCMVEDNAYYARVPGDTLEEYVCLGDSAKTPGASYADDGNVVIHELQHAATAHAYSDVVELNRFWTDEAGALNEAISDFMALLYTAPLLPSGFDPRVFSRWALGSFIPGFDAKRGAHRCPQYDQTYPACGAYGLGASGFSADANRVSFSYPDGLGWPYANNYLAPGYLRSVFERYSAFEEIHNLSVVMTGALWDLYEGLVESSDKNQEEARNLSLKLVMDAIRALPKPTALSISPVTFVKFAANLVESASFLGPGIKDKVRQTLVDRGLYEPELLSKGWLGVGPGLSLTPGLKIEDNPLLLKVWASQSGHAASAIPPNVTNRRADPGDVIAMWFDVANLSRVTAGTVELQVQLPEGLEFLDSSFNDGYISPSVAQVRYFKVNGLSIVEALSSKNATFNVPTGNSYFSTNPRYSDSWITALWVRVKAASGSKLSIAVTARPQNGGEEKVDFPILVN